MRRRRGWAMGFCVWVLRRPLLLLTKRDWRGSDNIPPPGVGCVLAVNHVSEFDPVPFAHFVYDSGRLPRYLGKAEIFKVPVVGTILRSAGQIPVYRQSSDAVQAFSAAVAAVHAGECVIVYPEGTISREPDLWPMVGKSGAARIALTTGCRVIPCAQWGPEKILAPYARRPRLFPRRLMEIRAGAAVDLSDLASVAMTPETLRQATERVMAAITSLLEDIRGATAPSVRFDPRVAGVPQTGNPYKPRAESRPPTQHGDPDDPSDTGENGGPGEMDETA